MAQPLLDKLDLDDVLGKFNVYDRYHAVSAIILTFGVTFNTMWYLTFIFVTEKVGYRCNADTTELIHMRDSNNISNASSSFHATQSWCVDAGSCPKWIYDNPNSFVAEFQLACQDWKRTLGASMHCFGSMVGLVIIGMLSDSHAISSVTIVPGIRNKIPFNLDSVDKKLCVSVGERGQDGTTLGKKFGRKTVIIITGVTCGILGLTKSFSSTYWIYVVLEFLEGVVGSPITPIFTLAIEMVSTKSRVSYTTICNAGFGGGMLLAILAWQIPYWRTLLRVMYTPGLLFIFFIYTLDESPRWLLSKGKKKEALKIIRNAAKRNKMNIKENLDMISYEKDEGQKFVSVILDTFKSATLLKRFAICTIWCIACTFVNHGLTIHSLTLAGNKYINFGLVCGMRYPSSILTGYIINKLNRRGPLICFFVACAVICIGQPYIPKNILWLLTGTYMTGKLVSSMCINTVHIFTAELFPTHTRNFMQALCSCAANIGSIMSTQTPLLVAYWSGLPTTLFGAMALVAGLATLLVPETGEVNLPDTVCQAETLEAAGRNTH